EPSRRPQTGPDLPANPQPDGPRRQPLGLARPMRRAHLARAAVGGAALWLGVAAYGQQAGPFTEAQAATGRSSYFANCAGCHQPDLRGANEAKPLAGPDFLRTWSDRSAQELVAFLSVTMP